MKVIEGYPPMIDRINDRFDIKGKPVLFAWGDTIYNPLGVEIVPQLMKHEEEHGRRQEELGSVDEWWERYIDDDAFRLDEEVVAHYAEYKQLTLPENTRSSRRRAIKNVAKRLANPLYGFTVSRSHAKRLILAESQLQAGR